MMESAMRKYRLNALDVVGRVLFVRDFPCRDDLEALEEGERTCRLHPVEIWDGARLVARLKKGNAPLATNDRTSL